MGAKIWGHFDYEEEHFIRALYSILGVSLCAPLKLLFEMTFESWTKET